MKMGKLFSVGRVSRTQNNLRHCNVKAIYKLKLRIKFFITYLSQLWVLDYLISKYKTSA